MCSCQGGSRADLTTRRRLERSLLETPPPDGSLTVDRDVRTTWGTRSRRAGSLGAIRPADRGDHAPGGGVEVGVGELRRAFAEGTFEVTCNPGTFVDAMVASVDASPAPLRLVLGSTAYHNLRTVLTERLTALEAQRDVALATDLDA